MNYRIVREKNPSGQLIYRAELSKLATVDGCIQLGFSVWEGIPNTETDSWAGTREKLFEYHEYVSRSYVVEEITL